MRQRWRSKRPGGNKGVLFIISVLLFFLTSIGSLFYMESTMQPVIKAYAEMEINQIASTAANTILSNAVLEAGLDYRDIIHFEKDEQGKIRAAAFNYNEYAKIVQVATTRVQAWLNEQEHLTKTIPLGKATESKILATFGPDIPVTFVPVGTIDADIDIQNQEVGINMVILSVILKFESSVQMVLPFTTEPTTISISLPLTHVLIVGDTPQFYYDGSGHYVGSYNENSKIPPPNIAPVIPIKPIPSGQILP